MKILVSSSAVVAFVVIFLGAVQGVDFSWYATWKVILGAVFGVDFLAATGATNAVLDRCSSYSSYVKNYGGLCNCHE